jgi:hypothetical protein
MPWLPRKLFNDWPVAATEMPTSYVRKLYEDGFAGCKHNPEAWEEFRASQPFPDGDDVAHQFGLADTGAGKLVVPFVHVLEMFPGCWPGAQGQARGDCVSWGSRNATLLTMVCDIVSGQPDEKTGQPEERPEVPGEGIADGVLSTEAYYWWRGYNGDGWFCPAVARVATQTSGAFLRKNYPELGVDLTRYSGRNAGLYGANKPPGEVARVGGSRLIHQATEATSFEARRDFLFNGYGLLDCGGEGYQDTRDANGVSKRSGSWAHSMSEIAVDDRKVVKDLYGEPLVLVLNSWAKWNRGPRDIVQSAELVPAAKKALWTRLGIVNPQTGNLMIPEGSFWTPWSHCRNREAIAYSGVNGWPLKDLPLDWIP